ncbi:MAG: sphingomyelin synthase family protein [Cyclobacteriaceae bacterium]|jgi:hypothetical protein|nr:sphingomyelin synthase family protein [Cyclobacteriaceae bacterium]
MNPLSTITWAQALREPSYRMQLLLTMVLLIACALIAPVLFEWIEQRPGYRMDDPLLAILPATDLSVIIFSLLYLLIITGIVMLAKKPVQFLFALQAFLHVTILRFTTLLLVPLEAPNGIKLLRDPFIEVLFYQQPITKDLFFSGHTGTLILLYLLFRTHDLFKWVYLSGAIVVSVLILIQHAHYTIDVVMAPVFVWVAFRVAQWYPKNFSVNNSKD